MQRFRKSPGPTEERVAAVAAMDTASVPIWFEQEPGSSGVIVIEHFRNDVLGGFDVHGEKSTGQIEVRATPFLAAIEAGNVFVVQGDWNRDLVDELNAFPGGDHDDQISACSLAYHKLVRNKFLSVVWGRFTNPQQREQHRQRYRLAMAAGRGRKGRVTW
jgi:predicted phage terminase large subunit-like protein